MSRGRRRRWVTGLALAALVATGAVVALADAGPAGQGLMAPAPDHAVPDHAVPDRGQAARTTSEQGAGQDAEVVPGPAAPAGVAGLPPAVSGAEPRIVKHAELALEIDGSVSQAFERVSGLARGHGGFVISSSTSGAEDGPVRAELVLRVPAERFDAARSELAGVGRVTSVQVGGEDVSAQLVDLDARLRALRAEEDALRTLLAEAGDVGEVLAVREQLSATRSEIERLAALQASLDDRASFATLRVTLAAPGAGAIGDPEPGAGLARSLARALDASVAVVGGMIVVLGYAVPFLVVGLLVWFGLRLARLRRRPA
jgi:hypothetical protein